MARLAIVADARWLANTLLNVVLFLVLLLGGIYLFAGLWWTLAAVTVVLLVASLIWKVVR